MGLSWWQNSFEINYQPMTVGILPNRPITSAQRKTYIGGDYFPCHQGMAAAFLGEKCATLCSLVLRARAH
jgi:hypothetical protein